MKNEENFLDKNLDANSIDKDYSYWHEKVQDSSIKSIHWYLPIVNFGSHRGDE